MDYCDINVFLNVKYIEYLLNTFKNNFYMTSAVLKKY